MNKFLVQLSNADVFISGKQVLDGINWRIKPGQHWRVIGNNGAGKSTLLKLIAGQIWPAATSPPTRCYGFTEPPTHLLKGVRPKIGFASYSMQDDYARGTYNLTAYEVIASGFGHTAMVYGELASNQAQSVSDLADKLGLKPVLQHAFLSLSHGQRSTALLARALVHRPRLLILDEILNGIDQQRFHCIIKLLQAYREEGGQLVLAWHETRLAAIEALFTHQLELDKGRLVNTKKISHALKNADNDNNNHNHSRVFPAVVTQHHFEQPPLIELQHVDVYLQNRLILENISWRIRVGDRWLINGGNGAGKTTLLRTLLAEVRPAIGSRIHRHGFDERASVWQIRKLIGYVSPELQQAYKYNVSVFDAVASGFFASIGLYDQLDKCSAYRVHQVLAQFNLSSLCKKGVQQISSGEMRRVLIARAMVHDPQIMMFDEITANLDRSSRRDILTHIKTLINLGKTMLFVSHHADELAGYYNRVITLHQGKALIETGNE